MRAASLLLFFVSIPLLAQTPAPHFVRASGEATVTAKPDRALIEIGVITHAATAQAAASQSAAQSTQVLNAVRQSLGNGGEVKTVGYSLNPQYDFANGRASRITGYEASNTVLVTVDDLGILGKVIDAASGTGANNINGISFTLKDDASVRAQALQEAAVKARSNAEALAKALNAQVAGILQAEPAETSFRPLMEPMHAQFALRTAAPSTPIQPGNLDIHATVTVTLEIR